MKIFLIAARIWTAIALLINAWVHFRLAEPFDAITGTLVSQGDLFRIQAVVNVLVAILVLVLARWWTGAIAALVAGGGLALILITVAVPLDLSAIGLPVIFEPSWYTDKVLAAVTQAIALIGGAIIALALPRRRAAAKRT